jgi:hypothetical protein
MRGGDWDSRLAAGRETSAWTRRKENGRAGGDGDTTDERAGDKRRRTRLREVVPVSANVNQIREKRA